MSDQFILNTIIINFRLKRNLNLSFLDHIMTISQLKKGIVFLNSMKSNFIYFIPI